MRKCCSIKQKLNKRNSLLHAFNIYQVKAFKCIKSNIYKKNVLNKRKHCDIKVEDYVKKMYPNQTWLYTNNSNTYTHKLQK